MNEFDQAYINSVKQAPIDNAAIDYVDTLWVWVGKGVAIAGVVAAIGYVIGGVM